MNKKRRITLSSKIIAISLLLSGCQSLTGYNQIDDAQNAELWAGKINPIADEVNISCLGTYHCEITQIDQTSIISPETHKPENPSMLSYMLSDEPSEHEDIDNIFQFSSSQFTASQSSSFQPSHLQYNTTVPLSAQNPLKIVPLSASGMPDMTNYYVRVKPKKREVHINFYPENNLGYVERFAIIHEFTEPGIYQLHAYRKTPSETTSSLLENASPNPLCIDLLQDQEVKRRFCKKMNSERQGEFVEMSMVESSDEGLDENNMPVIVEAL